MTTEQVEVLHASVSPATFAAGRHYASLLIRFGESVKTVQVRLGHATAAEILDTYSNLWPDSDDRTRDAIDSVLGGQTSSGGDYVGTNGS
jgi:integrase